MRCEEIQGLLDLYIDSELPEETSRKLDRHLLRCPACAYETRTLEQTRAMLREAVPIEEASPAFRERLAARLLDACAPQFRSQETGIGRQWTLPFTREEEVSSRRE